MVEQGKVSTWYMPDGLTVSKNGGEYEAPCPTCKRHGNITIEALRREQVDPIREALHQGLRIISVSWIREFFPSRSSYSNYSKGKWWGLLEKLKEGKYRITDQGVAFVRGEICLPSKLPIFENRPRYIEGHPEMYGEYITVHNLPAYEPMSVEKARENMVPVQVSPQESIL